MGSTWAGKDWSSKLDTLALLTNQGDAVPVAANLAAERVVLLAGASQSSRWFRPVKAGRVYLTIQSLQPVSYRVEVQVGSLDTSDLFLEGEDDLAAISFLSAFSAFRVVLTTTPANTVWRVVSMLV